MNKELKPCPFCGGEAGVSERYDEYCAVRCITCGAKTNFSMTKKGAIELWNRRKPLEDIVEQLEELEEDARSSGDFPRHEGQREIAILRSACFRKAIEIVKSGGSNEV